MKTRDLAWFDLLQPRDFENGAVLDEIHAVFKERDALQKKVTELESDLEALRHGVDPSRYDQSAH